MQGEGGDMFVNGGGVEYDGQALFGALFHDVIQAVDFVLHNQVVTGTKAFQRQVHLLVCDLLIAAAI